MAANKTNYIVLYEGDSQVYGSGSREVALGSPPPANKTLKDKHILFIAYQPDNKILSIHPLSREEIESAVVKPEKPKKVKTNESEE